MKTLMKKKNNKNFYYYRYKEPLNKIYSIIYAKKAKYKNRCMFRTICLYIICNFIWNIFTSLRILWKLM